MNHRQLRLNPVSREVSLQEEFERVYNSLFFNHLDHIIKPNQTSKELKEGAIDRVITPKQTSK